MNIENLYQKENLSSNILNSNTQSPHLINKKKLPFNLQKILAISLIFTLLLILIFMVSFLNKKNSLIEFDEKKTIRKLRRKLTGLTSDKWVVVTSINAPTPSIHKLTELPEPWKIVVIGDKKSKNHHIFVEKKDDQYRLDIDAIIKYITQSKKVNQTASKILT